MSPFLKSKIEEGRGKPQNQENLADLLDNFIGQFC